MSIIIIMMMMMIVGLDPLDFVVDCGDFVDLGCSGWTEKERPP